MGRIDTKGTKQLGSSLDAALVDEFREWLDGRPAGETLRQHLELAIRRHMATPPPPLKAEVPPLPPVGEKAQKKGAK